MAENNGKKTAEVESLVQSAQKGDSNSFGKLYDLFVNPIYKYIYFRVGGSHAEDLTELVFLKTWENIRQYKAGFKSFSSWIFRIAHNVIIDHYRSNKTDDELKENIEDRRSEVCATAHAKKHFDQKVLKKGLKELKEAYRQILILSYINDLSNEEIGNIMGRGQAALRILKFRALRSLRRALERMGFSGENA